MASAPTAHVLQKKAGLPVSSRVYMYCIPVLIHFLIVQQHTENNPVYNNTSCSVVVGLLFKVPVRQRNTIQQVWFE